MTQPAPACTIPGRPHPAHDGMLICRGHLEELARTLRDIEDEAIHLDTRPSMAISYNSSGGGLASERSPLREDVLAMLDVRTQPWTRTSNQQAAPPPTPKSFGPWCLMCDHETCTAWRAGRRRDAHDDEHDAGSDRLLSVLGVLHTWANGVRETRRLQPPTHVTLTGERDFLTRQLRWIAEQPQVAGFHAQLTTLLTQLRRANGTLEVAVGRCDSLRPDGNLCDGKVWHVHITADGKVRSGPSLSADDEPGFRCATCRRVWTGTDAVRKRNAMWIDEQTRKAASA